MDSLWLNHQGSLKVTLLTITNYNCTPTTFSIWWWNKIIVQLFLLSYKGNPSILWFKPIVYWLSSTLYVWFLSSNLQFPSIWYVSDNAWDWELILWTGNVLDTLLSPPYELSTLLCSPGGWPLWTWPVNSRNLCCLSLGFTSGEFHLETGMREESEAQIYTPCLSPYRVTISWLWLHWKPWEVTSLQNSLLPLSGCSFLSLSHQERVGEGNGTPLQYSCLENTMDGGAWKAAVHGVAQSWTRLKWLSSSSSDNNSIVTTRRYCVTFFIFPTSCPCNSEHYLFQAILELSYFEWTICFLAGAWFVTYLGEV